MDIQGKRQINTYEMVQTKSGEHWLTVSEWNNTNHTQVRSVCVSSIKNEVRCVFVIWKVKMDSWRSKPWSTEVPFVFKISLQNWSKKEKVWSFCSTTLMLSGFLTILGIVHQNDQISYNLLTLCHALFSLSLETQQEMWGVSVFHTKKVDSDLYAKSQNIFMHYILDWQDKSPPTFVVWKALQCQK